MLELTKCDLCKRYRYDEKANKETCIAFPDGIPLEMQWDSTDKECNNGIKFEEE